MSEAVDRPLDLEDLNISIDAPAEYAGPDATYVDADSEPGAEPDTEPDVELIGWDHPDFDASEPDQLPGVTGEYEHTTVKMVDDEALMRGASAEDAYISVPKKTWQSYGDSDEMIAAGDQYIAEKELEALVAKGKDLVKTLNQNYTDSLDRLSDAEKQAIDDGVEQFEQYAPNIDANTARAMAYVQESLRKPIEQTKSSTRIDEILRAAISEKVEPLMAVASDAMKDAGTSEGDVEDTVTTVFMGMTRFSHVEHRKGEIAAAELQAAADAQEALESKQKIDLMTRAHDDARSKFAFELARHGKLIGRDKDALKDAKEEYRQRSKQITQELARQNGITDADDYKEFEKILAVIESSELSNAKSHAQSAMEADRSANRPRFFSKKRFTDAVKDSWEWYSHQSTAMRAGLGFVGVAGAGLVLSGGNMVAVGAGAGVAVKRVGFSMAGKAAHSLKLDTVAHSVSNKILGVGDEEGRMTKAIERSDDAFDAMSESVAKVAGRERGVRIKRGMMRGGAFAVAGTLGGLAYGYEAGFSNNIFDKPSVPNGSFQPENGLGFTDAPTGSESIVVELTADRDIVESSTSTTEAAPIEHQSGSTTRPAGSEVEAQLADSEPEAEAVVEDISASLDKPEGYISHDADGYNVVAQEGAETDSIWRASEAILEDRLGEDPSNAQIAQLMNHFIESDDVQTFGADNQIEMGQELVISDAELNDVMNFEDTADESAPVEPEASAGTPEADEAADTNEPTPVDEPVEQTSDAYEEAMEQARIEAEVAEIQTSASEAISGLTNTESQQLVNETVTQSFDASIPSLDAANRELVAVEQARLEYIKYLIEQARLLEAEEGYTSATFAANAQSKAQQLLTRLFG